MAQLDPTNPNLQEIIGLDRQRQLSKMLLQQGMQQPQGEMVSGRFVAPAFTQRLANLLSIYGGQKGLEQADIRQQELAQKIRNQEAEDINKFFQYQYGAPAEFAPQTDTLAGEMVRPAVERNPQMAYQIAAQSQSPVLRQQLAEMLKGQKVGEGEKIVRYNPRTGQNEIVAEGGEKFRPPLQADTGVNIEFRDPRDPTKVLATVPKIKDISSKDFSNALSLRKEFNSEPIYKGYQEVKNAWNQINTGLNAKSPAGDLAAATKFMKLLDPTSVVRESELLMAMQASGALDRLYNYAQMRVNGTKLTPTQREDFRKLSDEFYQTSLNQYNEKFNEYKDIALRNNLNPADIGKPDVFKSQAAPKEEKPKPTVREQLSVPTVKTPKFLGFE